MTKNFVMDDLVRRWREPVSQTAKGPAEAATSPDRGSHHPDQENDMNLENISSRAVNAAMGMGGGGMLTARQLVDHHIAELQKALAALGEGPVRAIVGSDHPPVVQPLFDAPLIPRGVPLALLRWQPGRYVVDVEYLGSLVSVPVSASPTVRQRLSAFDEAMSTYDREAAAGSLTTEREDEIIASLDAAVVHITATKPVARTMDEAAMALRLFIASSDSAERDRLDELDRALIGCALGYLERD